MLKLFIALALFITLLSCSPRTDSASTSGTREPVPSDSAAPARLPARAAWEEKWQAAVDKAQKENRVVIYGSLRPTASEALQKAFKQKFNITVEVVSGGTTDIPRRLMAERQAGIYLADVYMSGGDPLLLTLKPAGVLDSIEPLLLLPEVTDSKLWWGNTLRWIDRDRIVLAFTAYPSMPLGINTDFVKESELRSFKDLLNPRFKGKIAQYDPTVPGMGSKIFNIMTKEVLGIDYWHQLVKQEPVIIRDHRQMTEWLARGKVWITISAEPEIFAEFIRAGAPIKATSTEEGTYLTSGIGAISAVNRPAHPDARTVFINWILSKEGQTVISRAMSIQSARVDVPTDHLSPGYVRQAGVKYFSGDSEEVLLRGVDSMKQAAEIFRPLMK